jgi:DNA-binding CsgD family transcriptional regulator
LILGDYGRATALLRELLHQSRKLDDKRSTQYAFFGFAGVAASQGQFVRATRLWAAADSLREASGVYLPPLTHSLTDYERSVAAVRAELGEAPFEEAWMEGSRLALEQTVEYALSEEESAPPTTSALEELPGGEQPTRLTTPLSPREQEVATLVAQGLTNRQISTELMLSEHTVATHVRNILKKLGLDSRNQVAAWFAQQR